MKLNLGSGAHPLKGFRNLDLPEWKWGKPLPCEDASVEGITVSHALMYAPEDTWEFAFDEMYRVLVPGGILRITEDATNDPRSERFGGWKGALTLTSAARVRRYMYGLFEPLEVTPEQSYFDDDSLIQEWHGKPPKVFHIEGRRL